MYVNKNFNLVSILKFSGRHIIWITLWSCIVYVGHMLVHDHWVNIPFLPLSIIGTAVAFYVGFKNNQAYDRLWEARKIWGAIVNSSRAWGSAVDAFVTNQFAKEDMDEATLKETKKKLFYRHIGWLYALRSQLLIPTQWEHISQGKHTARFTEKRRKQFGVGLLDDQITQSELKCFLPPDEYEELINYKNTATQIINKQARDLRELRSTGLIEDFRHMEMQQILYDFYVHQGKAERIKKFPLPRQYGSMSMIFVGIFIFLLPFGMISEFHQLGESGTWLAIPFTVLVSWIYLMMELVGDYSENPFEGLGNDIPMYALCRTIEIDMREMLGETELPEGIKPINGILL